MMCVWRVYSYPHMCIECIRCVFTCSHVYALSILIYTQLCITMYYGITAVYCMNTHFTYRSIRYMYMLQNDLSQADSWLVKRIQDPLQRMGLNTFLGTYVGVYAILYYAILYFIYVYVQ